MTGNVFILLARSFFCAAKADFFQLIATFFQRSFNVLSTCWRFTYSCFNLSTFFVGGSFILVSINMLVEHFKTTARVDGGGMERLVGHSFPHRAGRVVDPGTTGSARGRGEPKGRTLVDK